MGRGREGRIKKRYIPLISVFILFLDEIIWLSENKMMNFVILP